MQEEQTRWLLCPEADEVLASYCPRLVSLPAFDLIGFTSLVESGGEQYEAVRADGRWEVLRQMAGHDKTIYGVASHDPEAPEGHYRYTVAVTAAPSHPEAADVPREMFAMHIGASEWVVFALECFSAQYGRFWANNPYSLVKRLGLAFNNEIGLHIDAYPPSYVSDADSMEFMMPVIRPS
jgi:predicted transcriptional regulator YdeE